VSPLDPPPQGPVRGDHHFHFAPKGATARRLAGGEQKTDCGRSTSRHGALPSVHAFRNYRGRENTVVCVRRRLGNFSTPGSDHVRARGRKAGVLFRNGAVRRWDQRRHRWDSPPKNEVRTDFPLGNEISNPWSPRYEGAWCIRRHATSGRREARKNRCSRHTSSSDRGRRFDDLTAGLSVALFLG